MINHEKNKGLSAARLTGIYIAKGEYIIHCDSDDWVESNMYEQMLNKAKEEKADIVCAGFFYNDGGKVYVDTFSSQITTMSICDYLSKIPLGGKYSSLCNKLIKRELYFNNNVFPIEGISMWEDMIVTYRLVYYSKKIAVIPLPLYHYVFNGDSITSKEKFDKKIVQEQIKCAKIIDAFLKSNGKDEYEKYYLQIQFLMFMSKLPYLLNKQIRDLKLWQHTFQESNKYIMRYKELSFFRRCSYKVAAMGLSHLFVLFKDMYSFSKKFGVNAFRSCVGILNKQSK